MSRFLAPAALAAIAVACSVASHAQTGPAPRDLGSSTSLAPADDTLFIAFGGKAGLRALMEDFFVRLKADARIGSFFRNADGERLVSQLTEQLCYESGGPCVYRVAPMKGVHRGLEIDRSDFNALVEVLQQSMDAKGIAFRDQNRMLARLAPMHREIVTQ